ncbi:MAG: site-2 protease family protein [Bdellovibrionota bacterium]
MEEFGARFQMLSVQFVPFIMAIVFHEFAHGLVASRCGDQTARDAGRLTLNPIPHIDMLGTIIFPLINMISGMNLLFGWAKPVPINPARFKKYRLALCSVSAAGPGMNFFLAFISAMAYWAMHLWLPQSFYLAEPLAQMAVISVQINYALGIFNLIPLPPLDGSKIIEAFLPYEAARRYESIAQYSFFILMALLLTGALSFLGYPIFMLSKLTMGLAAGIFGISTEIL